MEVHYYLFLLPVQAEKVFCKEALIFLSQKVLPAAQAFHAARERDVLLPQWMLLRKFPKANGTAEQAYGATVHPLLIFVPDTQAKAFLSYYRGEYYQENGKGVGLAYRKRLLILLVKEQVILFLFLWVPKRSRHAKAPFSDD